MDSRFVTQTLSNGLQVVIEVMPTVKSAACGFMTRTGSRDETPPMAGVSHFLEHMCFKGTATRTAEQINVAFDEMGAFYNAYTSKERTFYYGWVPRDEMKSQLALLADMMQPALPPDDFDTEKNVVLEEIAMSNDQIGHVAFDFLHEQVLPGHGVSWPVLGYSKTVGDLSRDQMDAYRRARYAPDNLLLIVAGNVDPEDILAETRRLTADWTPAGPPPARTVPAFIPGKSTKQMERFNQQEIALVYPSAGVTHPLDETAEAAVSILGGGNSRIYWNVVQEGISSRAGAWRMDYHDFGLLILTGVCDPENCERLVDALRAEAQTLLTEGPKPHELQRVKNKRRTSLAVESEAPYYRLNQLIDDVDHFGEPRTVEQRLAAVDAVTAETVRAYFSEFPIDLANEHLISVGPRDWPGRDGGA